LRVVRRGLFKVSMAAILRMLANIESFAKKFDQLVELRNSSSAVV